MTKWFYVTPQKTHQEFNEDDANGLIRTGAIRPETLIWNESMPDWRPAREIKPEWFTDPSLAATAPPASAATSPSSTAAGVGPAAGTMAPSPSFSPPPASAQSDPLAVASLICGIVSIVFILVTCFGIHCIGVFALITAIPGVVTGHLALGNIKKGVAPPEGKGLAVAGLIMSYTTVGLFLVLILLALVGVGLFAAGGMAPFMETQF